MYDWKSPLRWFQLWYIYNDGAVSVSVALRWILACLDVNAAAEIDEFSWDFVKACFKGFLNANSLKRCKCEIPDLTLRERLESSSSVS